MGAPPPVSQATVHIQCCQVLTSIHGHVCQKPRPFSKLSCPPIKKLPLHDISKHNHNKKTKNSMFGEGFCHFFYFCSPFLDYTSFLNLTTLLLLTASFTASISHRKSLLYTAGFELFSSGHGHLATLGT